MANTSAVYARIDSGLKADAEAILAQLGITPSSAIQMFYRQVVLTRGLPLELHLPAAEPTCIGGINPRQLREEIQKGRKSQGSYTPDQVDEIFREEFGI